MRKQIHCLICTNMQIIFHLLITLNLQVKQVWHTRVSGHRTISTAIRHGATAALPRTIGASSHPKNAGRTAPGHAAHSRSAPPCSHQPEK